MKKNTLILFFTIIYTLADAQTCREVIAYYPNWQWYDRNQLIGPANIDYSQYSIINYAFFEPLTSGMINSTDAWADENLLLGQPDWQNGGYLPNTSLIDLAHNHGVKVLASIGGWTLSNTFPALAADSFARMQFASSCCDLIRTYGFDGIDIDWEYPGYATHNGTAADGVNFTYLLQTVRDSLEALSIVHGQTYMLTSCFSADPAKMSIIEWNALDSLLDYFNLMSYDFFGAWDSISNHNSPLYAPLVGDSSFNIDAAFTNLCQVHGVNSAKINIGVAFYGRSVTNCTSLHGITGQAPDLATFSEDEGSPLYYNILKKINLFTSYWDSIAKVPYLLGNSINTFVSYDNERSIAAKAQYVLDNSAAGLIIWELTGDYIESGSSGQILGTPLADTLNAVLCGAITSREVKSPSTLSVNVFPNPQIAGQYMSLNYRLTKRSGTYFVVTDMYGREVYREDVSNKLPGEYQWSFTLSKSGIYYIQINTANSHESVAVIFH